MRWHSCCPLAYQWMGMLSRQGEGNVCKADADWATVLLGKSKIAWHVVAREVPRPRMSCSSVSAWASLTPLPQKPGICITTGVRFVAARLVARTDLHLLEGPKERDVIGSGRVDALGWHLSPGC